MSFKGLDLHPKLRGEFSEKTRTGGVVSLVTLVVMVYLFVSQLVMYWSPRVVETMSVDDSRSDALVLNFDIRFPTMPCALISLDVMDLAGQHQQDVMHNVFKRRIDMNGKPFDESQRNKLGQSATTVEHLDGSGSGSGASVSGSGSDTDGKGEGPSDGSDGTPSCGSCYGAGVDGQCCNSCSQVQALYKLKGWSFDPTVVKQCASDAILALHTGQAAEGCNLYGSVEVPRVAGNIHFAPGRSFQHASMHVHDMVSFTVQNFNVSHTITQFSIGKPYPGQPRNPLDAHTKTLKKEDGNGMFQYYVKVVPTDYVDARGRVTATNQYSVTEHFRPVSLSRGSGLPGVFFFYDVSPIRVTVEQQNRSFLHFLTQLCAIIGGVFTVMGIVDTGVHTLLMKMKTARTIA